LSGSEAPQKVPTKPKVNPPPPQALAPRIKQSPITQRIRTRNGGSESSDLPESILSTRSTVSTSSRTFSSTRDSPALKKRQNNQEISDQKTAQSPKLQKKNEEIISSNKEDLKPKSQKILKSSLKSNQPALKKSNSNGPNMTKTRQSFNEDSNSEESDTDRLLNRGSQKLNKNLRERYVSISLNTTLRNVLLL